MADERIKFNAEVKDVYSGDDLVIMIELGIDDLYKKKRVRLYGVDTPNAVGQGPDTRAGTVRDYVQKLLHRKKLSVTILTRTPNSWIGIVEINTPDGVINLNEMLIAEGYKFNRDKGI